MLCQASRSRWKRLGITQAILHPLALPLVGPHRLEGSGQRRVCPRRVRVERLAPALALLPFVKNVSMRRGRSALCVDQTAPLVIVANHPPEREGAAVPLLSFLFLGVITSHSTLLTRSRTRRMMGARCVLQIYQLLCLPVRMRAVQVHAPLEIFTSAWAFVSASGGCGPSGAACWRAP